MLALLVGAGCSDDEWESVDLDSTTPNGTTAKLSRFGTADELLTTIDNADPLPDLTYGSNCRAINRTGRSSTLLDVNLSGNVDYGNCSTAFNVELPNGLQSIHIGVSLVAQVGASLSNIRGDVVGVWQRKRCKDLDESEVDSLFGFEQVFGRGISSIPIVGDNWILYLTDIAGLSEMDRVNAGTIAGVLGGEMLTPRSVCKPGTAGPSTTRATPPKPSPKDTTIAVSATHSKKCESDSLLNGWKFTAYLSDNDGLVLTESFLDGTQMTHLMSAPYLEAEVREKDSDATTGFRLELTPEPSSAHDGAHGSELVGDLECESEGDDNGDTYARATFRFSDLVDGDPSKKLTVVQEYRFRMDDGDPCEPSGRLSCARFWPSITYDTGEAVSCMKQPDGPPCNRFASVKTVQRFEFAPEGVRNGGLDAFQDKAMPTSKDTVTETKGHGGSMKEEDADEAIVDGRRGDWDSLHWSPEEKVTGPTAMPPRPGCPYCIHMHWAWGPASNALPAIKGEGKFTDGEPQILPNSAQDARFGVLRSSTKRSEIDPVKAGWDSLWKDDPESIVGANKVIIWEMTGTLPKDAAFPVLPDYEHGGNGAIFFGIEHDH